MKAGIIGLGIMGSAYAKNLLKAGFDICGFDVAADRIQAFEELGGSVLGSPKDVAGYSDVILLALPSVTALHAVYRNPDGIQSGIRAGTIICEMGTLPLEEKQALQDALEPLGVTVLDCPVSGTGAQAAVADLSIYVSGDASAGTKVQPLFEAMARDVRYVGEFGSGIKLKYVANLLVSIHNLAAAEALLFARQSGLDLDMVLEAITHGAGTSRMLEIRGPMMIKETYKPATMKMDVYMKDLELILDQARKVKCPTPMFAASLPFYFAALAEGRDSEDTAALYSVLKNMVGR